MGTIQLIIKGKVQGVFYRVKAKKEAEKLNITGRIKNKKQGDVEAIISGEEEQLQKFIEWCRKGPDKAEVDDVVVIKTAYIPFDEFTIEK